MSLLVIYLVLCVNKILESENFIVHHVVIENHLHIFFIFPEINKSRCALIYCVKLH